MDFFHRYGLLLGKQHFTGDNPDREKWFPSYDQLGWGSELGGRNVFCISFHPFFKNGNYSLQRKDSVLRLGHVSSRVLLLEEQAF